MLDLQAQYATIRGESVRLSMACGDSQHFILGPEVEALEKEVSAFCQAGHAIGVSSGTNALLVALMAAGVAIGDEVLPLPSHSLPQPASLLGLARVLCSLVSNRMGTIWIARGHRIETEPRTKAIITVHLFGYCAQMEPLLDAVAGRK